MPQIKKLNSCIWLADRVNLLEGYIAVPAEQGQLICSLLGLWPEHQIRKKILTSRNKFSQGF